MRLLPLCCTVFYAKLVNCVKLWTRSKTRAAAQAQAIGARSESTPKRSPIQRLALSARQLFSSPIINRSQNSQIPSTSLDNISESAGSDESEITVVQAEGISNEDCTPLYENVTYSEIRVEQEQIQANLYDQNQTSLEEPLILENLPHPPEGWLEDNEETPALNQSQNPLYQTTQPVTDQPPSVSDSLPSYTNMEENIERQLENLRIERESHERKMNALHNACQETLHMRGMFNLPVFSGDECEDVNAFISNYKRVADLYEWPKEKQAKVLPLYLKGSAIIWYNSLPNVDRMNFDELVAALNKHFSSAASQWRLRQMLNERKQKDSESLKSYSDDIRKQCSRLNLSPDECLSHFIKGLRADLKEYVALQQPSSYEEAENLAKLKDVLSAESKQIPTNTAQLTQEIIEQLKKEGVISNQPTVPVANTNQSTKPTNCSAQENSVSSLAYPSLPTQFTPSNPQAMDFQRMVSEEVRRQMSNQNNRNPTNSRNFARRTRFGVIICNYCQKPGHAMYNCRAYNNNQPQNQTSYQQQNQPQNTQNQRQNENRPSNNQRFRVRSNQRTPQGN